MKMFSEQLPKIAGGALDQEMTDAMVECVEHIDQKMTGPCEIVMRVKLVPQQTRMGLTVKVTHKVETKLPKEKPLDFVMFLTPEGNLEMDNPKQGNLPFQPKEVSVETPKPDVVSPHIRQMPKPVTVNPETGEIL